ncbi:pentapeptide repeat-containing protein (plasmid) [Acaryochloris sp. 'Moss Beach']|uniref:pentapeptide repeat-containing protein n=1 Tax=Acaryochloris sp. 'Moss Beach' TaxID=2740837 RepID=UPI0037C00B01|nr:pentapeptide repeat-containing protein [Acaryochloris sp. 'Moss Beach']
MQGQSFENQDLSDADFSGSDIREVNFSGAILRNTDFTNVKAGLRRRTNIYYVLLICLIALLSSSGAIITPGIFRNTLGNQFF